MSRIKNLKQNEEFYFNIVDVLELFSPNKKSKYTETLIRLMLGTKNLKSHVQETKQHITSRFNFINKEDLNKFSDISIIILHIFIDNFFNNNDLRNFRKFCEYNERGLIGENDLSKYKTFDQLLNQLSLADIKSELKGLENETIKVYEDDMWLLVRPLSYLSSKKYGSNTKWCTTTESNSEYFIKYSSKGVLIYCINKITGYKVASFCSLDKNDPEFSFWNQVDNRVDSIQTELPHELIMLIKTTCYSGDAKTNRFYLSDDLRKKEDDYLKFNSDRILVAEAPQEVMVEERLSQ